MRTIKLSLSLIAVCATVLALSAPSATAQPLKPFIRGSLKEIVASQHNAPFVLTLWSLNCAYCREEFRDLSKLVKKRRGLRLVLVSTDTPADRDAVLSLLRQYALDSLDIWLFGDEFADRLRFEIDPTWYGELPRTIFFREGKSMRVVSGSVPASEISSWLDDHPDAP